nr:hypothetical protein [Cupriavidus sp. GA3-3]
MSVLTRRRMPTRQDIALVQNTQADILDLWSRGLAERDKGIQDRAAAWLNSWNEKNPESPILINGRQLQSRVKQMATPSADRMLKGAPKGLRGRLAGEFAAGRPAKEGSDEALLLKRADRRRPTRQRASRRRPRRDDQAFLPSKHAGAILRRALDWFHRPGSSTGALSRLACERRDRRVRHRRLSSRHGRRPLS